ncbi:MAG: hypothetical protein AAGC56_09645 [Pseudomonadota bacterium]
MTPTKPISTKQRPLALLAKHQRLLKRPVIQADRGVHFAWTPTTHGALGLE